jgi:hypothetical protein
MELAFPTREWRLGRRSGHILFNVLSGSPFRPFRVLDIAGFVKRDHICKNCVNRLEGAWLLKNTGIIDTSKDIMANRSIGYPESECSQSPAK